MFPILGNISYVNYAITAAVGGYLVIINWMDIGGLASFLQFSRTFAQPLAQMSQQMNVLLSAMAGAERIFAILREEPEVDEGTVTLDQRDPKQWYWVDGDKRIPVVGNIQLHNVDFGYVPGVRILKDINVWAEPGLKVAFVGATGAGKTTITNLINRFYEIDSGVITFDEIPVTKIKKDDLRKTISIVLQDTHLFTGTIADNIRYGNLDATDDEVIKAAIALKALHLQIFINHIKRRKKRRSYNALTTDYINETQVKPFIIYNPVALCSNSRTASARQRQNTYATQSKDCRQR